MKKKNKEVKDSNPSPKNELDYPAKVKDLMDRVDKVK